MAPPKLTAECETLDAIIGQAGRYLSDPPGQYTIRLETEPEDASGPWLTVTEDQYPPGMWPPMRGDKITVTIQRVVAATRG